MGSARCRATPALNQSGGGGESFNHLEEVSPTRFRVAPARRRRRRRRLLRIVHARGAIPDEMGPTRCRATPALTNQSTRPAPRPPGACRRPVLAVCPSWTLCLGGQTATLAGRADCPILHLVSGWSGGLHSLRAPPAPSRTGGEQVTPASPPQEALRSGKDS